MDLHFRVPDLPTWKQAVQAYDFNMSPGGKGLNQAVASARQGAEASLISAVGDDEFGKHITRFLEMERVTYQHVKQVPKGRSDVAGVFVHWREGEPAFIGWKGLGLREVDDKWVRDAEDDIKEADAILITFEVTIAAVEEAISIAKEHRVPIFLNPAPPLEPGKHFPPHRFEEVDVIIPNLWEGLKLLGKEVEDAKTVARLLCEMGPRITCVTTSGLGCVVATEGRVTEHEPFYTPSVDTTGGSDAFCATLAISLARELRGKTLKRETLEKAIMRANAAGSAAVGRHGGASSMPSPKDIDGRLEKKWKETGNPISQR